MRKLLYRLHYWMDVKGDIVKFPVALAITLVLVTAIYWHHWLAPYAVVLFTAAFVTRWAYIVGLLGKGT